MSILLNTIDCPYLTDDYLQILNEKYSISTTNDFLLWKIRSSANINEYLSSNVIDCIYSCVLVHTSQILSRQKSKDIFYSMNDSFFDQEKLLKNARHLLFIYEKFTQYQWNEFFPIIVFRLYKLNPSISIKYLNTNPSLFHFTNETNLIFDYSYCFDLKTFENELDLIESNSSMINILIIDDFLTLIKPYLNLDRRIKMKISQLTSRLNYLAQKYSILIINGFIIDCQIPFECFHGDYYLRFQVFSTNQLEIYFQNRTFLLNLDQWKHFSIKQ